MLAARLNRPDQLFPMERIGRVVSLSSRKGTCAITPRGI